MARQAFSVARVGRYTTILAGHGLKRIERRAMPLTQLFSTRMKRYLGKEERRLSPRCPLRNRKMNLKTTLGLSSHPVSLLLRQRPSHQHLQDLQRVLWQICHCWTSPSSLPQLSRSRQLMTLPLQHHNLLHQVLRNSHHKQVPLPPFSHSSVRPSYSRHSPTSHDNGRSRHFKTCSRALLYFHRRSGLHRPRTHLKTSSESKHCSLSLPDSGPGKLLTDRV